jgi:hypothetical protein
VPDPTAETMTPEMKAQMDKVLGEIGGKEACKNCPDCDCNKPKAEANPGTPEPTLTPAPGIVETEKRTETASLDSEKGKVALTKLLESLPPDKRAELEKALQGPNPPHVHIDENQNVFIGEAADRQVEMRKEKGAKVSNIQMKRMQAFNERVRRWINGHQDKLKGLDEKAQFEAAVLALQREDYEKLPDGEKVKRLESLLSGFMQQVGEDFTNLRNNQFAIADAYEINHRALAKMFVKLGISLEDQGKIIKEAQQEIAAEHKAEMEKEAAAQVKKLHDTSEKKEMKEEAKKVNEAGSETKGTPVPDGATTFGG